MCGIAGFDAGRDDETTAARLCASLTRRGPDGSSWGLHAGQVLVQTRLAVIDLSPHVVYPLANEDRTVFLVFNGEVYGHDDLRADLERRGHRFRTRCDAEVVVHAFEEWDVGAFERLNGMFAVAIVDERDGRTVLARDRFGIKPLVYTDGGRFAWGSDAMALVRSGLTPGEVDHEAIAEFAAFHYVPAPRTDIDGISQLPPGTVLVRAADRSRTLTRFAKSFPSSEPRSGDEARDHVDAVFADAVKRQLVADVPVGVLLSSGIDSALVLAYAVEAGACPRAFTIAFKGSGDYDETQGASTMAAAYGVPHEIEQFDMDFATAMGEMGRAFDQPFADPSSIAMIQLARLARRSVKVVLRGSGGDETFAGYYRLRAHKLLRLSARAGSLAHLLTPVQRGSERVRMGGLFGSYGRRLLAADSSSPLTQYMSLVGSSTSLLGLTALRLPTDLDRVRQRHIGSPPYPVFEGDSTLRRLMAYETGAYLPGNILAKEDRATMHTGLEARVPILDELVARTASSIPDAITSRLLAGSVF